MAGDPALAAALKRREARDATPFGMYVLHPDDPAAELARSVEREVFLETFGNTAELLDDEYGPYEQASRFLLVLDHERLQPAGVARIVVPSPAGSKTIEDLRRVWGLTVDDPRLVALLEAGSTWDVATLAVGPGYRRRDSDLAISAALVQGIVMFVSTNGGVVLTATLDEVVLGLIQQQCRDPFEAFPGAEPRSFLDSPASLPVFVDRHRYERRLAEEDAATYEFLFRGIGLEATVTTPDWRLSGTSG